MMSFWRLLRATSLVIIFTRFVFTDAANYDGCGSPLGMEDGSIKDEQITSKTWLYFQRRDSRYYRPYFARLNYKKPSGGWCSADLDKFPEQFVVVDLLRNTKITHIATQGRHDGQEWVEHFKLEYQRYNETRYRRYMEKGKWKIFDGNSDLNSTVKHEFNRPIIARRIKIIPVGNRFTIHCMRFELFGCTWSHAKDGIVSYSAPLGEVRKGLSLQDDTYDGYIPFKASEFVFGGIGKLMDGNIAEEGPIFRPDMTYTKWVGYKSNPMIMFTFNDTKTFSSISFYVMNKNKNLKLFEKVSIEISTDGTNYNHVGSYYPSTEAKGREGILQIKVSLNDNIGMYLRCSFDLQDSWLLLTEIEFDTESRAVRPTRVTKAFDSHETKLIKSVRTGPSRKTTKQMQQQGTMSNNHHGQMLETDMNETNKGVGLSFPIVLTIVLVGIVIVFAFFSFIGRLIYSSRKAKKRKARNARQSSDSGAKNEEERISLNRSFKVRHEIET